jgi:hypothetical protein
MKKRYVIIGLLASSLMASAQRTSSPFIKKKLVRTDVEALLSFYTQDNNHSAVTGGIGTEDLQVYIQQYTININKDSVHIYHLDGGVDIISSASTDNIDFEVSSASKTDARSHINLGYSRLLKKTGATIGANSGFSIESDYLSISGGLSAFIPDKKNQRDYSILLQSYFDDLRWGRFENGRPQKLIYPQELRSKNWFDHYRRTSVNLELGINQVINRRMTLGLYPGFVYQSGLLSTPFHRVYFSDNSERVETLPGDRWKFPVGIQLNSFIHTRYILRTSYRFFKDNFGILAHTVNVEVPIKLNAVITLTPFVRGYMQTASDYFQPYKEHDASAAYYTSDYDLSRFKSIKTGLGFRYAPFSQRGKTVWQAMELRYARYDRSDGLTSHMITAYIHFSRTVEKEKPL